MWNPFRKKDKKDGLSSPQDQPQTNTIDALANKLQREGRIDGLEQELEKLDQSPLSEAEKESWWHTYGIAAFRAGRDAEATTRFENGLKLFPNSAHIQFSLGQQYVRARRLDEGFKLFFLCTFPHVPRDYIMAQARYAYLWNRYSDGRVMIRPFLEAYKQLKILDDHFLYVRGLPFFGTWWSYLAAFSILDKDTKELEEVTEYVEKNCHDYDFQYLRAELSAYRDDKPELVLSFLENRLKDITDHFPSGFTRMKIAVIRGREVANLKAAESLLDDVSLTDRDFPWLQDIRTLAKAEIAHRFNQPEAERQHTKSFLVRQPMLFEPDIALNFHLLRYQERLKLWYQET